MAEQTLFERILPCDTPIGQRLEFFSGRFSLPSSKLSSKKHADYVEKFKPGG